MASTMSVDALIARLPASVLTSLPDDDPFSYGDRLEPSEVDSLRTDLVRVFNDAIANGAWPDARLMKALPLMGNVVELVYGNYTIDPETSRNVNPTFSALATALVALVSRFPDEPMGILFLVRWSSWECSDPDMVVPLIARFLERLTAEDALKIDATELCAALQGVSDFAHGVVTSRSDEYRTHVRKTTRRMLYSPAVKLLTTPAWRQNETVVGLLARIIQGAGCITNAHGASETDPRVLELFRAVRAIPLHETTVPLMRGFCMLCHRHVPQAMSAAVYSHCQTWWAAHRLDAASKDPETRLELLTFVLALEGSLPPANSTAGLGLTLDLADGIDIEDLEAQEAVRMICTTAHRHLSYWRHWTDDVREMHASTLAWLMCCVLRDPWRNEMGEMREVISVLFDDER